MNLKETLEKYPKASELYYQWIHQVLINLQVLQEKEIPDDVERHIPEVTEEFIKLFGDSTLLTNWRSLFDFFDGQDIIVWPVFMVEEMNDFTKGSWGFEIRTITLISDENEEYKTRIEAEKNALAKAFEFLEEKLNKQ